MIYLKASVDRTLENLLELDGVRFLIDYKLGLWVKFEAKKAIETKSRQHAIRYSLSLHDRSNKRIMGFDNSHPVAYAAKKCVSPKRILDHWHKNASDKGQPYHYENAAISGQK